MSTKYYPDDDILVVHLSDEPIAKEVSASWNVNVSFTASGDIAEIVVLDAKETGLLALFKDLEDSRGASEVLKQIA
jgi:Protein of unknown function (DUF2283).